MLPFGFIRDPALLWRGDPYHIFLACGGILCGTSAWAIALQGWLKGVLRMPVRVAFAAISFIIVYQPTLSLEWSLCVALFTLLTGMCFWPSTNRILCRAVSQAGG